MSDGDDPSTWDLLYDGGALPTKVKIEGSFPRLRSREAQDGLPFTVWRLHARAALGAAQCRSVLDTRPPTGEQSQAVRVWYGVASPVVYAALLGAVVGVQVLHDEVLRMESLPDSAYQAWRAVQRFFVREASTNRLKLLGRLRALEPAQNDSMEAFLNRCELLRSEWGL